MRRGGGRGQGWAGGIGARERTAPAQTRVQEVPSDDAGVRVFVVQSDERLAYERGEREKAMQRVRADLAALEQRVAAGKIKAPEKIGAAATRILTRHHGYPYYDWTLKDGTLPHAHHPLNLAPP